MDANAFLTARDVADRFSVSERAIYSWVDRGLLPAVRVGTRLIRFTEEGLAEFLRRSDPMGAGDSVRPRRFGSNRHTAGPDRPTEGTSPP